MLLAIDIGNTNITFGLFQKRRIIRSFNITTQGYSLKKLKAKLGRIKIEDTIICSVVPKISRVLERDLRIWISKRPYNIGKDIIVPIRNLYRIPKQVGQDRLVNAYAGVKLYGSPLIVVDFGTAITFDIISKKKEYLGGMIIPGLNISLEALNQRTALLPKIKLGKPKEFIGRDTRSSMLSGIVYGFGALTDDLVNRIRDKIGRKAQVIATGGNISLISKYCKSINRVDSELTLKGLNMIYSQKNEEFEFVLQLPGNQRSDVWKP
ncbi:MAG: type III pantothenate kinase [Candidatus Omnitrophica bacterium]|nr:type III pantothenate kinase [Candidatus Omnitrophota bacterium]